MTQEYKELLLKDLCARMPYGVKFACNKNIYIAKGIDLIITDEGDWEYAVTAKGIVPIEIDFIKPYLFPISSMTEEQYDQLYIDSRVKNDSIDILDALANDMDAIDWLNKNLFDYRGLIEKGLAIDATGLNIY